MENQGNSMPAPASEEINRFWDRFRAAQYFYDSAISPFFRSPSPKVVNVDPKIPLSALPFRPSPGASG